MTFSGGMIFLNSLFDIFNINFKFLYAFKLKNVKNFVLNLTNVTSFNFFQHFRI